MGQKRKYIVTLTEEERKNLKKLLQKGNTSGMRIRYAQILLRLDEIPANKGWTGNHIAEAYDTNENSVTQIAKRFVEEGLESALSRRPQQNRARKINGEVEAKVIALACQNPPDGHERWTVRLLRDEVVAWKLQISSAAA